MNNTQKVREEQLTEREIEHRARLKRHHKRKVITGVAVFAVLAFTPLFILWGDKLESKVRKWYIKQKDAVSTWNMPDSEISLKRTYIDQDNNKLHNEKSDIEGLSKYEKMEMGLEIQNGSDTDGDGLTDKAEIEIYKSDPLKCSTSGDLYSDKYKIDNGMDIFEKYDYTGDPTIKDKDNIITLYAKTPYDLGEIEPDATMQTRPRSTGARAFDCTETAKDELVNQNSFHIHYCLSDDFYRAYMITGYDGDKIDIDLNKVAQATGKRASSLDIEIYGKRTEKTFKTKRNDDVITVAIGGEETTEGSPFNAYEVYVVDNKRSVLFNAIKGASSLDDTETKKKEFNKDHGLIVISPLVSAFTKTPPKVYCSEDITDEEKKIVLDQATKVYRSVYVAPIWVQRPICDETYITYMSTDRLKRLSAMCEIILGKRNKIPPNGDADPYQDHVMPIAYQNLGDFFTMAKQEAEDIEKAEQEENKKFTLMDEFSFDNFTSVYTGAGVCTGMSRVTAEVYNNGAVRNPMESMQNNTYFPENILPGSVLSYDITPYEECKTFSDRYIDDYSTTLNRTYADEDAVMRMITWYWADGNNKINEDPDSQAAYIDPNRGRFISWDTIEKAMYFINRDQILLCGVFINNNPNGAHFMNLVDYTKLNITDIHIDDYALNIEDAVRFVVYDSNFSQNFGYLTCYKYKAAEDKYMVLYEYDAPRSGGEKVENYTAQYLGFENDYFEDEDDHGICLLIATDELKVLNVPLTAQ